MNKLLTQFLKYSIGSLGAAALNFLTIPIVTYFISPTEYGKTSMFFLVQTILLSVIYLGFDQAFAREFYEVNQLKKLLFNAMALPIIISFCLVFFLLTFKKQISTLLFSDTNADGAIYLLCLMIFALIFERFLFLLMRVENKSLEFSFFNILVKFAILVCTLLFLIFQSHTYIAAIYGTIIGQLVGDSILVIRNWRLFSVSFALFDKKIWMSLFKFALPIFIATVIYSSFTVFDKIIIRAFSGFAALGLYTAAFKVASVLLIVQTTFANFWMPTAYEWYKEKRPIKDFQFVSEIVLLLISILFVFMLMFKDVLIFLLSPEYKEAKYIFPFLCFYPLMMTLSETTNLGIVFLKKGYLNIFVSTSALIVSIILNLTLIPSFGPIGGAIATGSSYIVFFFIRTYFAGRAWQPIKIKKHMIIILCLLILALCNVFIHDTLFLVTLEVVTICIIILLFLPLLNLIWKRGFNK
ncbi:lipopolysaccharide biosynthesis protein [Listeria sp. PSOL-1]|uniref:lipopolysaccharide biosynthesis protein n=1 Tax=Listeria sp. PSOL-1 TaxID=1844999 RepID=UPI0013D11D13|nr:oligosaccharide flippase family protein [Listeria sp. PSOL-1]